ncbi:hypothetical protein WJX72_006666 [[Myrmecia] bisecta]|uniref:Glycosyltransferase n=1 Tax=[Myrmecia] bisecta TaxID=41462 RepID=A0AAW1Q9C3_9CHLO
MLFGSATREAGGLEAPKQRLGALRHATAHVRLNPPVLPPTAKPAHIQPRVAILNAVFYHTEVVVAVMQAVLATGANLTVFADPRGSLFKTMWEVVTPWCPTTPELLRPWQELEPELCDYDVIIWTTFPMGHHELGEKLVKQRCQRAQQWLFVIHDAMELSTEDLSWGPPEHKQRVHAILKAAPSSHALGIAPHVVAAIKEQLTQHDIHIPVSLFNPVYDINIGEVPQQRSGFIIQGSIDNKRRNYSGVWDAVVAKQELLNDPAFLLRLVGAFYPNKTFDVPPEIAPKLELGKNLEFKEYYRRLARSLAVLPAFATEGYYQNTASSTIGASLVTRTPIVADAKLLSAYSSLNETCVYLQAPGETYADTMLRILRMPQAQRDEVHRQLDATRQRMLAENAQFMTGIVHGQRQPPRNKART